MSINLPDPFDPLDFIIFEEVTKDEDSDDFDDDDLEVEDDDF